ncbi:hypothetical protein ACJRO7_034601 [Eucalyptus globulus]|uniref:Uncharacterized protein n=1 Tax=Eucalyptus globulus TaxID=34317 RepID=A0ABD3J3W3_EUCGL
MVRLVAAAERQRRGCGAADGSSARSRRRRSTEARRRLSVGGSGVRCCRSRVMEGFRQLQAMGLAAGAELRWRRHGGRCEAVRARWAASVTGKVLTKKMNSASYFSVFFFLLSLAAARPFT